MKPGKIFSGIILLSALISLWFFRHSSPLIRLSLASIGMIWIIKLAAFFWQKSDGTRTNSLLGTLTYFLAWPGISLTGFSTRATEPPPETGQRFFEAWISFLIGVLLLITVSLLGHGESTALNYVALFSILLIIHLGLIEVIADALRLLGFSPQSLFNQPYLATSLRDFWSLRWNRAFVDMNKIFLLNPLRELVPQGILVFSIFLISGLLHEMGISFADNASWGCPLLYFLIQGIGMQIEKHKTFPRIFVWLWIVLPAPLLFTPTFTNLFLGTLGKFIWETANSISTEQFVRGGLLLGGFFHLLVLCASVQVPEKLGWKNEFQKLLPLNRKVFWTYGGYIFSIIVFMGLVSFLLSKSEILNSPAVILWIIFIALFWWARVLTDFFYFKHNDWPKGPLFTVGHICLTTLFVSLAILYTTIAICLLNWRVDMCVLPPQ